MFQHIFFSYGEPKDFRKDFPEHEDDAVVAIKVTPNILERFVKGQLEKYGETGNKVFLSMLEETDVFHVQECEFYEV